MSHNPSLPPNGCREAALYAEFQPKLMAVLKRSVHAPHEVLEDACSFAWLQFVTHRPDPAGNPFAWLCKTAQREAWRLCKVEQRELPLTLDDDDAEPDGLLAHGHPSPIAAPDEHLRLRAALAEIARLSPRRRAAFSAHVAGVSHREIAEATGWSHCAVDALVRKSRARIRDRVGS